MVLHGEILIMEDNTGTMSETKKTYFFSVFNTRIFF